MSILVDTESERFLGASVLGITGDEIVPDHQCTHARRCVLPRLAEMLPIHPTVAEFYPTILGQLEPMGE